MKHNPPARLTQSDVDHYNSLPPGEKLKAWESYSRMVAAGELEPFAEMIEKPKDSRISDRLRRALDAGSTVALFPLLAKWDKEELRSLIGDIDAYGNEVNAAILKAHGSLATQPENFFSKSRSKSVDAARDHAETHNLAMCAEIISVALYYLGDEGSSGAKERK